MRTVTRVVMATLAAGMLLGSLGCAQKSDGWIELFNGKDMTGWKLRDPSHENSWKVEDGILKNFPDPVKHGVDIYTDKVFNDFALHVEFKVPPKSNSGIYLRGRYEVQINSHPEPLSNSSMGAIYGEIAPSELAANPWNEWQIYDIWLCGEKVTVKLNGKTVIDGKELPGPTGAAMKRYIKIGTPGPIMLQGDHGEVWFRSIKIKPCPCKACCKKCCPAKCENAKACCGKTCTKS